MFVVSFRPFFKLGWPSEFDHQRPEACRDERIHGVVEEPDGHEAEDEVRLVPVPEILVENRQEYEDRENDFTFHRALLSYQKDQGSLSRCRRHFSK